MLQTLADPSAVAGDPAPQPSAAFDGSLASVVFCLLPVLHPQHLRAAVRSVESFHEQDLPAENRRLLIVNASGHSLQASGLIEQFPDNVFEQLFDPPEAATPGDLYDRVLKPVSEPTWLAFWGHDHFYHPYRLRSQFEQLADGGDCCFLKRQLRVSHQRSLAVLFSVPAGLPSTAIIEHFPGVGFVPSGSWEERVRRMRSPVVLERVVSPVTGSDVSALLDTAFWHPLHKSTFEEFFGPYATAESEGRVLIPSDCLDWLTYIGPLYGLRFDALQR